MRNRVLVEVGADVAVDAKLEVGALSEQVTVRPRPKASMCARRNFAARSAAAADGTADADAQSLRPRRDRRQRPGSHADEDHARWRRRPRHRLQHQRRAHGEHQHPARRRRQQLPVRHLRRPGSAARLRAGVLGHHEQLLGAVRPRDRRIVNVVTKSGTNASAARPTTFSGTRSWPTTRPTTKPTTSRKGSSSATRPGYSLGGPIVKDKVHFFSSLEYIGVRSATR